MRTRRLEEGLFDEYPFPVPPIFAQTGVHRIARDVLKDSPHFIADAHNVIIAFMAPE